METKLKEIAGVFESSIIYHTEIKGIIIVDDKIFAKAQNLLSELIYPKEAKQK